MCARCRWQVKSNIFATCGVPRTRVYTDERPHLGRFANAKVEDPDSVGSREPSAGAGDAVRDAHDVDHLADAVDADDVRAEQHAGGHGRGGAPLARGGRLSPIAAFRNDLREGPDRIGRSRAASVEVRQRLVRVCSARFAKPSPGSRMMASRATPGGGGARHGRLELVGDLRRHVRRTPPRDTSRASGRGCASGRAAAPVSATTCARSGSNLQPADVVDDRRRRARTASRATTAL